MREVEETGRGRCVCVCVYSLLDILDLHAGRAAATGAHEGLRPQLRDLCTSCLKCTSTHKHQQPSWCIQISATVILLDTFPFRFCFAATI